MTLAISNEDLNEVKRLLDLYLPGVKIWSYGSRVNGHAKSYSDLDLLAFITPEQKSALYELRIAFDESNLPFSVDILPAYSLPEDYLKSIENNYEEI